MSPSKILYILSPSLKLGGAERTCAEVANYASKKGVNVIVILFSKQPIVYELNTNVLIIEPQFKKSNPYLYYLKIVRLIRNEIKRNPSSSVLILGYHMIGALACTGLNCRLVGSIRVGFNRDWKPLSSRSLLSETFQYFYRISNRILRRRFDGMIHQTERAYLWRKDNYRKSCEHVVINNFLREIKHHDIKKQKLVISVGRLSVEKGHIHLLEAFKLSDAASNNWKLQFIGDGPQEEKLKRYVSDNGLSDHVEFLGFKSDVDYYLQSASVFVLPSLTEGFPNALMEAMANGLPCISFDCETGPAELIMHEQNGLLVPTADVNELASCINRLINNAELRNALGKKASEIRSSHSQDKIADKFLSFIFQECPS